MTRRKAKVVVVTEENTVATPIVEATVTRKKMVVIDPRVPDLTDRMTSRTRPAGPPLMKQTWDEALFLHWRVPIEALRPLVPPPLSIDTHHGGAWVGITPFKVRNAHPAFTPPVLPWTTSFNEVNARTYVYLDGVPGVWFFSLDASSPVAVIAARTFFRLAYFDADVVHEAEGKRIHVHSTRLDEDVPATLSATWTPGSEVLQAGPGSLEFFWTERYCFYTAHGNTLYRGRIYHEPWPLREVPLAQYETTLLERNGVAIRDGREQARLLAGGPVDVEIWPLERLGSF
jgi:hypothetical protein